MHKPMTECFEYHHTVTHDEIDEQGHANNVVFVAWMQAAAIAHTKALGWTSEKYKQLGGGWVARSHTIDYLQPAFVGDRLIVRTWVAEMKKVTSIRRYQIIRESDRQVLAKAETNWAFIDYATGKPRRIPAEIINLYQVTDH
ncbi:MAG: thioesterase family protein [Thermoguttaceae bacterium]|jgi:acyl-CoA thioester hydrolase